MPKLSIITVNLNNAVGLEKTIRSVISQTFTDYEYIIIDGGSTDGSVEVIKKYADKITYWVSEPDKGIYNAMNKGIKVAKGEYCQFLNSGDYLVDKNVLEKVFSLGFDEDIVYGNILVDNIFKVVPYKKLTLYKLIKSYIPHPASFISRTVFFENNFYDEKYKIAADWKFFLKTLILENYSYAYVDLIIADFQSGGISTSIKTKKEKEQILFELFPRIYPDYNLFEKKIKELEVYQKYRINRTLVKVLRAFNL